MQEKTLQELQEKGEFLVQPSEAKVSLDTSQWPLLLKVGHFLILKFMQCFSPHRILEFRQTECADKSLHSIA